ncbi:MAG TPA: hypothetical protein PL182_11800 [Pseudobdellovibrionaceae bacterium]|nr:hypothetical protein [Pseudobdellovibrionaceae bacterium]
MLRRFLILMTCLTTTACGAGFQSLDQLADSVWIPIPNENRDYPDMTPSEEVVTVGGPTPGYRVRGAIGEITEDVTTANHWKVRGVFHE